MQATISKWGNSLALRLPRHLAEEVKLMEGTTVCVEVEDGSIRVTPSRPKFRLADLLADEPRGHEYDWGEPTGEEVW